MCNAASKLTCNHVSQNWRSWDRVIRMPSLDSREVVLMAKMEPRVDQDLGFDGALIAGYIQLVSRTFAYKLTLAFLWNSH
jgi:hypothetical protein